MKNDGIFVVQISYLDRRHTLAFLNKELTDRPIQVRGFGARAVLEISLEKWLCNKAQVIFMADVLEGGVTPKKITRHKARSCLSIVEMLHCVAIW